MDIFIYRPLVFGLVELFLAYKVWRHGEWERGLLSLFILFLAGYQLGEFLIFAFDFYQVGFRLAFASTTMLVPLGIRIFERVMNKNFGSPVFLALALVFAFFYIFKGDLIVLESKTFCIAKFMTTPGEYEWFVTLWSRYYGLALVGSFVLQLWYFWRLKPPKMSISNYWRLKWLLISNSILVPISTLSLAFFDFNGQYHASLMCGMAIGVAFIAAHISLRTL